MSHVRNEPGFAAVAIAFSLEVSWFCPRWKAEGGIAVGLALGKQQTTF